MAAAAAVLWRGCTPAPRRAGGRSTVASTRVRRRAATRATARRAGCSCTRASRARAAPSPGPAHTGAATRRQRVTAAAPRRGRVATRAQTRATRGRARRARCSSRAAARGGTARRASCRASCRPLRARGCAGGGCGVASTGVPRCATWAGARGMAPRSAPPPAARGQTAARRAHRLAAATAAAARCRVARRAAAVATRARSGVTPGGLACTDGRSPGVAGAPQRGSVGRVFVFVRLLPWAPVRAEHARVGRHPAGVGAASRCRLRAPRPVSLGSGAERARPCTEVDALRTRRRRGAARDRPRLAWSVPRTRVSAAPLHCGRAGAHGRYRL